MVNLKTHTQTTSTWCCTLKYLRIVIASLLNPSLSYSLPSGSVTNAEVQGLMSGTRYYFKMGACTEMGVGPYSPVKDVYTPPKKYGAYVFHNIW